MTETPKKRKSSNSAVMGSDSAAAKPENSRVGKSKKRTIVEVEVIVRSPRRRRRESKKAKAKKKDSRNPEGNDMESRDYHPPSSPSPAEQTHRPVEDKRVHVSLRQRSDSDDELILAPKPQPSSKQKGKQKARESHPVDRDALSEINPSNGQVATSEEEGEEPRNDEHNSPSCAGEPESPAPLLVSLISIFITSIADPT